MFGSLKMTGALRAKAFAKMQVSAHTPAAVLAPPRA